MNKLERVGRYIKSRPVAGESYEAYVPNPLPPTPSLDLTLLYPLLDKANAALGRLDGMSLLLPDPSLFLYMYVRKEAVLSSQIEGTQSSLSDLLLFEAEETPNVPLNDVTEVSCYVSALYYGLERLDKLPLSLRLICEMHAKLMNNARGNNKSPGEFRSSQNWIGGNSLKQAIFIPPPVDELMACLDNFERFLHDSTHNLPVLVKAALAHVQFETIHPFLDGNGRLGRLLITFILCVDGVLDKPLLYLSLYLKTHREAYYNHLQSVRETGDWESWIAFFLTGVLETATEATKTAQHIIACFNKDRSKLLASKGTTNNTWDLYAFFQKHPITTASKAQKELNMTKPTLMRALKVLEQEKIIDEVTGKSRHKIFVYKDYLDILSDGVGRYSE